MSLRTAAINLTPAELNRTESDAAVTRHRTLPVYGLIIHIRGSIRRRRAAREAARRANQRGKKNTGLLAIPVHRKNESFADSAAAKQTMYAVEEMIIWSPLPTKYSTVFNSI